MSKQPTTQNLWRYFQHNKNDVQPIILTSAAERFVDAITEHGADGYYFASDIEAENFRQELTYIIGTGRASFITTPLKDLGLSGLADNVNTLSHKQKTSEPLRIKDSLMQALQAYQKNDQSAVIRRASDVFNRIVMAGWDSDSPGVEFTDNINKWHPTPNSGPIGSSSYLKGQIFMRNSYSPEVTINLLKYLRSNGSFDHEAFRYTVEIVTTTLDIALSSESNLTEEVTKSTLLHRPLAIGYSNLALFLMAQGIAYDSKEAKAIASTITALMTGQAYLTSANLAYSFGPFPGFYNNRAAILSVLQTHRSKISSIDASLIPEELLSSAVESWDRAVDLSHINGLRNAQVTCLSSNAEGRKNCVTASVVPITAKLWAQKALITSGVLERALKVLKYKMHQIRQIIDYIDVNGTIIGAPYLYHKHIKILSPTLEENIDIYNSQLKIMTAVQPFLSGGIAVPITLTKPLGIKEAQTLYLAAWKEGLKLLSFTVVEEKSTDGSDSLIRFNSVDGQSNQETVDSNSNLVAKQAKMRNSKVLAYNYNNKLGYLIVCEDNNGQPEQLIIKLHSKDIKLSGQMDDLCELINVGLRRGIPLNEYINRLLESHRAEIKGEETPAAYMLKILRDSYLSFTPKSDYKLGKNNEAVSME